MGVSPYRFAAAPNRQAGVFPFFVVQVLPTMVAVPFGDRGVKQKQFHPLGQFFRSFSACSTSGRSAESSTA